jgi:DNA-binding NarL/FixJ family response regulator
VTRWRPPLTLAGGFEVVATVGSGEDAVAEALRRAPDVVVMDLEMPGAGGVAATAEILPATARDPDPGPHLV